jgi:hypothetical protein
MMEGPEETEITSLTQDIRAIVEASIGGGNGESPD